MKPMLVRKWLACWLLALSACASTNRAELVRYDLGAFTSPAVATTPLRLEIRAPTWLQTPAMQYKLAYADPAQRYSYANARWVAAPPELLEAALRRGLVWPALWPACRMQFELDEFIQLFTSVGSSTAVIELRGRLLGTPGKVLGEQAWSLHEPGTLADAAGGVASHASAIKRLLAQVNSWLSQQSQNADINKQCSSS